MRDRAGETPLKTWVGILISLLGPTAVAQAGEAAQVRVSVLSKFAPERLAISAVSPGDLRIQLIQEDGRARSLRGKALDLTCGSSGAPVSLSLDGSNKAHPGAKLRIRAPGKDSPILISIPGKKLKRPYFGWIEISEYMGYCQTIVNVKLEQYVRSVTCAEIRGATGPALRAQSVLVRTWALTNSGKHHAKGFDFCDLTHCQAYQGVSACSASQAKAIQPVEGQVLLHGEGLADVAYFSTCGGHTARASDIWGSGSKRSYLDGVRDGQPALCASSDHFRWIHRISKVQLCALLRKDLPALGSGPCSLTLERGRGGWIRRIRASAQGTVAWSGEAFHLMMGRLRGWGAFKSANFVMEEQGDQLVFLGRGMGHGVGMCQHGAMGMALSGKDHRAILEHYFPGTRVGAIP